VERRERWREEEDSELSSNLLELRFLLFPSPTLP
jgi:hypothetical protein